MSQEEMKHQKEINGPKVGRTLLVKPQNGKFNTKELKNLPKVKSSFTSEKTNSYFLTFEDKESSKSAYDTLMKDDNCKVKYALYRLFFKLDGLVQNQSVDYNSVKEAHKKLVSLHDGDVLYYKLYRRNDKYLGCGELTVDTKKSFDKLLDSDDGLKTFKLSDLGDDFVGTHFRYNRNKYSNDDQNNSTSFPMKNN
tara:strand:- start:11 stop:595 length:585 start_codon:yes stop_codon:yes gene_type:complete